MDTQEALIRESCQRKTEEPWLEFKKDNYRPDMIGEDVSALANSATLYDHDVAYMIWGIDNTSHQIALLFAKRLKDFPNLEYKAIRVTQYEGNGKLKMLKDAIAEEGYAISFDKQVGYIEALLPSSQPIIGAERVEKKAYPTIAIRELLANAILHQDLSERGTFITVDIFAGRIEITNPGRSLVAEEHLLDSPPKTRNEHLAALGRRMHFCEEAGTGWDKTICAIEQMQMPSPRMELREHFTRVSIWPERPFKELSTEERIYACYVHACIRYLQGDLMTNSSFRERFGLAKEATTQISRLIKQAVIARKIKVKSDEQSRKFVRYLPIWV